MFYMNLLFILYFPLSFTFLNFQDDYLSQDMFLPLWSYLILTECFSYPFLLKKDEMVKLKIGSS